MMRLSDEALMKKWEAAERIESGRYARPFVLGEYANDHERAKAELMGLGLMVRAIDGEPELRPLLSLLDASRGGV